MRRVLTFLVVLTIAIIAIIAFAQSMRRTGMFYPDRYPLGRWDTTAWSVTPSEHWITTDDNVRLHAWLFRANDANAPLLVWFHGNAGNLTNRADTASELAKRGISVFLFDYRGFGRSEGTTSESNLFRDGEAIFAYASKLGATRVVCYGESVGGPYAARVARDHKDAIAAVIIENSFPSLKDIGNALYAPLPLGWTAPFALRTTDWLNEAGRPVLVMHGTRDAVIPYALGKKLYDDLRVPKELLTSNAGHSEIPDLDAARYYEAVIRFATTAK